MLDVYGAYKDGHLPMAGGLFDQAAWLGSALTVVRGEMAEAERKHIKK